MFDADAAPGTGEALAEDPPTEGPRGANLRRVRNIALALLLVVVLGAAGVYGPTLWRVAQQRDAKISTPERVADLQLDHRDGARETAEYVRDAVATSVKLEESVAAVYSDTAAADRSVIFAGGSGLIWNPEEALSKVFALMSDETGGVTGVRDVRPGPLGGQVRCGSTATPEGDLPVCGWADHGSVGIALFPNRSVDEAAEILLRLRTATQSRS